VTRAQEIANRLATVPAQTSLEVIRGMTIRKTAGGIVVGRLHYSAHPERDPELQPQWKTGERKAYASQAAWDREQEIVDEAGGGELVFADVLVTHWDQIVIEDPAWRPDSGWDVIGGFDHGKTNPTALLRAYVDFEGNLIFAGEYYMPGREIWQHAPVIRRMEHFERMEAIQADPTIFHSTSQQVQRPGHAIERAKSFAELYDEQGVTNFVKFPGDTSDVSFAGRLHHWANLDQRMPSVRIFCPRGMYSEKPHPGLHDWGCPNLLWELMRARRVKLGAQQLLSRNTSEAIVDKDNHARDAMKYAVMSLPEASRKPFGRRMTERMQATFEELTRMGADPDQAMTTAVFQFARITHEEQEEDKLSSTYYGGSARQRIVERQREIDRRYRAGWRWRAGPGLLMTCELGRAHPQK